MDFILHPDIFFNYFSNSESYNKHPFSKHFVKEFFDRCNIEKSFPGSHMVNYRVLYANCYWEKIQSMFIDKNHLHFFNIYFQQAINIGLFRKIETNLSSSSSTEEILDSICENYSLSMGILIVDSKNYNNKKFLNSQMLNLSKLAVDLIDTNFILYKIIINGSFRINRNNFPSDCKGEAYPKRELELQALFDWIFNLPSTKESVYFYDDYFQNLSYCSFLRGAKKFGEKVFMFFRSKDARSPEKKSLPNDKELIKNKFSEMFGKNIKYLCFKSEADSHVRKIFFNDFIIIYSDDLGQFCSRRNWDLEIIYAPNEAKILFAFVGSSTKEVWND